MSIELPKDAEGREIPLDTEVLYDVDGGQCEVSRFAYWVSRDCDRWDVVFANGYDRYASEMYLNPPALPDSWEKLEEDLCAVETYEDSPNCDDPACAYARNIGKRCAECKLYGGDCAVNMCTDIAQRIRKLRGED